MPELPSSPCFNLTPHRRNGRWRLSVISATDFLWTRHCRKAQSMSSFSLTKDFPDSMGQQPESHFYGSSLHEGREKKSISVLLFIKLLQHYGSKLRWGRESLFQGKCCLFSGYHSATERSVSVQLLRSWETFSQMYTEPEIIILCIASVSCTILFHTFLLLLQVHQEPVLQFHS